MRGERTALLVVDMLNAYEHDDAAAMNGRYPDLVEPVLPPR